METYAVEGDQQEATYGDFDQYSRPNVSPNLSAIAAFTRPRQHSTSTQQSASSSVDNLSDPPPRSILPSSSLRVAPPPPPPQPERPSQHLSPTDTRGRSEPRPSSRKTLTRALELAKEAVALDGTDIDPHGAVLAYGKSVALLSEVMERVRKGEDTTSESSRRAPGRRRSVVAQEEEIRRLKAIHDTYADRMNILSLIYSIPPQPLDQTTEVYSPTTSSNPTRPPSPPSQMSFPPPMPQSFSAPPLNNSALTPDYEYAAHADLNVSADDSGIEAIGVAMFSVAAVSPGGPNSYQSHPFAANHDPASPPLFNPPSSSRASMIARRPRASSNLPPPPPPPVSSPPPPPTTGDITPPPQSPRSHESPSSNRLRPANVPSHHRTGSGSRLNPLQEEQPAIDGLPADSAHDTRAYLARRESHPLPPLPSPSVKSEAASESPGITPRHSTLEEIQPVRSYSPTPQSRSRSGSTAGAPSNLINTSPSHGTISKRRVKASAPPSSMRPASPTGSSASIGSIGSLPPAPIPSSIVTRARAVSQPGRRPLNPADNSYEGDFIPPLPSDNALSGFSHSRGIANGQPLMVQTDLAPSIFLSSQAVSGAMPLTPISPMPAAPPNDPLRKPYHLMHLLMITMTSPTGGYLTKRLHVPQEVWSQGGAKLTNLSEKAKVVEVLSASLEELQTVSAEYFGAGNVSSGMALGIGSIGRKEGESWVARLDDFSAVCEGMVANLGKKLGVGEGFVSKKHSGMTSWGSKLSRRFDKLTSGKNIESPSEYVAALVRLFNHVQLLDEHTQAVLASPIAPSYAALPLDVRSQAEMKLRRSSEFFASVVLTFVMRDLSQLLDKYAKQCGQWLIMD